MLTLILITALIILITSYAFAIKQRQGYFKNRGITGPPHIFFFGHFKTLWQTKSFSKLIQAWSRQYGSIYGLFAGTTPMYVVSDVDFLQEVYVKQFSSFSSRHLERILRIETDGKVHLFRASGSRWRRQRHVINPSFSTAKLKMMSSLVNDCISALLKKISENVNNDDSSINIYELYKRLTMDVICRCAFGIDTDMQNDTENIYLKKCAEVFQTSADEMPLFRIANLFPILARPLHYIVFNIENIRTFLVKFMPFIGNRMKINPIQWLLGRVQDVIDLRQQAASASSKRVDLLQLMMDAVVNKSSIGIEEDSETKVLYENELIPNIFLFMVAGYETTSTALAYSTYVLSTKPDIQEKLLEEILNHPFNDSDADQLYDTAMNLTYLDNFVHEVLRMYPITSKAIGRICINTTTVGGHTIEEGCVIQPDLFTVHFNPDLWGPEDPNEFCPERHAVKRHPMAWMPFGVGPRNCIGMRFALMELKMCLIRLLRNYRISSTDKTVEGFQLEEHFVIQPKSIFVKLEPR